MKGSLIAAKVFVCVGAVFILLGLVMYFFLGDAQFPGMLLTAVGVMLAAVGAAALTTLSAKQITDWQPRREGSRAPTVVAWLIIGAGVALVVSAGLLAGVHHALSGVPVLFVGGMGIYSGLLGLRSVHRPPRGGRQVEAVRGGVGGVRR